MKINRLELIAALEAVSPGLANKEIIEQSTAFVFTQNRVFAYNDNIAASHPVPKGLNGAVQSKELYALLVRTSEEEVDVETTDKEMLVKAKRSKAGITLQANITLPLDAITGKKVWTALPEGFTTAIGFVLFSASTDMTKPELTGVHLDSEQVETCDNFRLTRYTLPGKGDRGIKGRLIIPATACAELVKYDPTHYSIDDQWMHFTNKAGTEFSCRTIAGEFPDLSPFIDRKWEHEVEFHADTVSILDRACVFLNGDKTTHTSVTIKVASGRMIISARGAGGWFEETVHVTASKESFEFIIDPQALKDMLPLLKDCELSDDKSVLKFEGKNFIHTCATVVD